MQYQLQIFHDEDRREFRTYDIDGEPWFVLADVCRRLDIGNPAQAATRLDEDEKGIISGDTPGGRQAITIVNESGLFSLILTSRKPEAKRFKKWVTSEVLPSIRRTGGFDRATPPIPASWQPFHDRLGSINGAVPEGYFSVFHEMVAVIERLVLSGIPVDHRLIPDISVGSLWSRYWQEKALEIDYGDRVSYPHSYPPSFPQSWSNPQDAWAYPEDALSVFRRWLRNTYLKIDLPRYLRGKVAKGVLPEPLVSAALVALGSLPAPTRLVALPA